MASKKKRNKKYHGEEATQTPGVIKITAPDRSAPMQWYHENKQLFFIRVAQVSIVLIIGSIIYLIFG